LRTYQNFGSRRFQFPNMMNLIAVDHLVANAGIWSSCFFEEITNLTAFHNVMVSGQFKKNTLISIVK
jgi:hypothetical protein